jgi:hypothetical protein
MRHYLVLFFYFLKILCIYFWTYLLNMLENHQKTSQKHHSRGKLKTFSSLISLIYFQFYSLGTADNNEDINYDNDMYCCPTYRNIERRCRKVAESKPRLEQPRGNFCLGTLSSKKRFEIWRSWNKLKILNWRYQRQRRLLQRTRRRNWTRTRTWNSSLTAVVT